jgi:hypothetical protein
MGLQFTWWAKTGNLASVVNPVAASTAEFAGHSTSLGWLAFSCLAPVLGVIGGAAGMAHRRHCERGATPGEGATSIGVLRRAPMPGAGSAHASAPQGA